MAARLNLRDPFCAGPSENTRMRVDPICGGDHVHSASVRMASPTLSK
jgi:hypothetical protein